MDRNKKTAVFGIYPSLEAANSATDVLVKERVPIFRHFRPPAR